MNGVVKFTINPETGRLSPYRESAISSSITESRICLASAQVGEFVMESEVLVDRIDVTTGNGDIRPVFAIIIEKTSDTTCNILLLGQVSGFSGLTKGRKVFLSDTGGVTSTPPTTGYVQSLGVAKEESIIDFRPNMQRVKRTP